MGSMGIFLSTIRVFIAPLFILAIIGLQPFAFAAELSNYPGWFIDRIAQENEEGVIGGGPEYYSLKPGDGRPAITVSAGIAAKLKSGQLEPEATYNRSAKDSSAATSMGSDEYVYGSKGLVQADPLYSTATTEQQPSGYREQQKNLEVANTAPRSAPVSDMQTTIFSPPVAAGSTSSSQVARSFAPPSGNKPYIAGTSGASASPVAASPVATAATAATNAGAVAEAALSAKMAAIKESANKPSSSLSVNNTMRGIASDNPGDGNSDYEGSGSVEKGVVTPPCVRFKKVFSTAGATRVQLPMGCSYVTVTLWGAGGGTITQRYTTSQGRDGNDVTRTRVITGRGGSYIMGSGDVVGAKNDLVVVVGGSGDNGEAGGFSALYFIPKSQGGTGQIAANILATARGGKGAGGQEGKVAAGAPGPFSSYMSEDAGGSTAAFRYGPERGNAGNSGVDGKVILEVF